jgi:rod shape-determining protein MreB
VSDDPLSAVANGTGVFLNNIDELYRVAADF